MRGISYNVAKLWPMGLITLSDPAVMSRRTNSATSRLRQDYMRLKKDPVPYIVAEPLPSNILEWHYVVEGPESR